MHVAADGISPEPATRSGPEPTDAVRIPRAIMQLALVLDSILAQEPPADPTSIRVLREGAATGTTAGFRDLEPRDLIFLSGHLAILSNRLAQQAAAAREIPEDSEGSGL